MKVRPFEECDYCVENDFGVVDNQNRFESPSE